MWSIYCLMQRVRGSRIHIVLCVDGIMQRRTVTLGDIRNAHSGLRGSHSERPWNVHEWPTLHSAIAQSHFRSCTRTVRSESTKKKHTHIFHGHILIPGSSLRHEIPTVEPWLREPRAHYLMAKKPFQKRMEVVAHTHTHCRLPLCTILFNTSFIIMKRILKNILSSATEQIKNAWRWK